MNIHKPYIDDGICSEQRIINLKSSEADQEVVETRSSSVKSSDRKCGVLCVPLQGGTPEAFDDLQKAYNILSNDLFKAAYDDQLPKPSIARRQVPP